MHLRGVCPNHLEQASLCGRCLRSSVGGGEIDRLLAAERLARVIVRREAME